MVLAPVAFGGRRPCFTFINAKYFVNGGTNHPEQLPVLLARGLLSPHGTNPTVNIGEKVIEDASRNTNSTGQLVLWMRS